MRRALVAIVSMSVACGGSAPPPTHPVATDTFATTPSTATEPKPEPKPETVASADPCEGGQVDDDKGLGSLGTIGAGGGGGLRGSGRGGGGTGAGRPANSPTIQEQPSTVSGGLDKDLIHRIVRRHVNELKFCFEKELQKDPHLAGRVVAKFTIDKDGMVIGATAEGINPEVSACIAAAIRRWEFPKPAGGGIVTVTYPFTFASGSD